jgi:hypothetical protein
VLSEIPLFASLSANEVQALAQRAVENAGIFPIAEGVKIFKTAPSGREMMLAMERLHGRRAVAGRCLTAEGIRRRCAPRSRWFLISSIRLARMLLDASRQAQADEFPLPLSHQEIASRGHVARSGLAQSGPLPRPRFDPDRGTYAGNSRPDRSGAKS